MKPAISRFLPSPPAALTALFAGALNVFAFAPFHWWPLQIATLALLFHLIVRATSLRSAALIGWLFGFGWSVCGVHWLYISMHDYGGMPAPMAALAVVLLALYLGIFPAAAAAIATSLRQRGTSPAATLLLALPALWALSEWLRGWLFTGFPWVSTGYAHTSSPLAGFAPLLGVYGVGWLAASCGACLALAAQRKWIAIVAVIAVMAAGVGLHQIAWTVPHGAPISVRLLQGNVPQEMKFDPDHANQTLTLYEDMMRAAPADLIATPETALPLLANQLPEDYLPRLSAFASATNSHLAIGVPVSDGPRQYANSVIGIAPGTAREAAALYRYDKHHLVPFGEFIPFGFRWFVDMMRIPLGDFTRGAALQSPFNVREQWVLPNICYEDLFGEEIAAQLRNSASGGKPVATMLLNMSNIAWFGDSIALPQHLQISQMRAIETGRPMLRATNTGATAVVDPNGNVQTQLPPFERGVLTTSVLGYTGLTPYVRIGNAGIVLLASALLLAARFLRRKSSGQQ
ncbi:MAG TPA: apolipoprotein N-acyltransferase [Oxalicibacterium sp.]|nr:apolipoprotein N-acyltransferase [Oxalicibacterium sp.]